MQQFDKKERKIHFKQLGEMVRVLVRHRDQLDFFRTFHSALDPSTFVFHDPVGGPWTGSGVLGNVIESDA